MRKHIDTHDAVIITFITLALVIVAIMTVVQPIQESKAYNRLTGAKTTPWDAFWLDLRVQDTPK